MDQPMQPSGFRTQFERARAGLFALSLLMLVACSPSVQKTTPATTSGKPNLAAQVGGEGGWESSGGGGVACFRNEAIARLANNELRSTGFLSPMRRSQIQSVVTLDAWEYFWEPDSDSASWKLGNVNDFIQATSFKRESSLKKGDPRQVFKKVLTSLSKYLPMMSQRLEMIEKHIPLSAWKSVGQVPIVNDATTSRPLAKNCVRIQIANRASRSQSNRLPQVEISYDEEIFNRFLSDFDKALLISHEYLYVLGREGNHRNSDLIRKFNALLFSVQGFYPGELISSLSKQVRLMRTIADYPFGDYMRFFKNEASLLVSGELGSQNSRYHSLIQLMDILRKEMAECLEKENYKELASAKEQLETRYRCQKNTIERNPSMMNNLTEEQAFVFLGRFFLDQENSDFNSEHLTTWSETPQLKLNSEQDRQLNYYCRYVEKLTGTPFGALKEKTQFYCKNVLAISPQSPKQPPFRRDFSCFSKSHLLSWHSFESQSEKRISISLEMNSQTGEVYSPPFSGNHKLLSTKELSLEKDLGFGNRRMYTQDIYQLAPANDEDQNLLRGLIERDAPVFVNAEVLEGEKVQSVKSLADFKKSIAEKKSKILKLSVALECLVTTTNLPEKDWYY